MNESSASRAVYVISVAAELAGVHPQTLRIYERKGLLEPARTGGGSRRYSEDDIRLLQRIQDLTESGLNLAGVEAGARAGGRERAPPPRAVRRPLRGHRGGGADPSQVPAATWCRSARPSWSTAADCAIFTDR